MRFFAGILLMQPVSEDSPRNRAAVKPVARRVDNDEPRDQAGDEKRSMSIQETMYHDGNRLAGEE
jgi:hypothetical protein